MKRVLYWSLFPFRLLAGLAILGAWVILILTELVESKVP